MTYLLIKFVHIVGFILIGGGLMAYGSPILPGALLLLGSGTWLIFEIYGGWVSYAFHGSRAWADCLSFSKAITVTRLYFLRLRRSAAGVPIRRA